MRMEVEWGIGCRCLHIRLEGERKRGVLGHASFSLGFLEASGRERQGNGGGGSGTPRWQRLRRNRREKAGTAPSYGAGLKPAPPPPLCSGLCKPCAIPPFRADSA